MLLTPDNLSLVIYIKDGQIQEQVKKVQPDEEYLRIYNGRIWKNNFSGRVFLWNWLGELLGGSYYKDGLKVATIKPITSSSNSNARAAMFCNTHTTCYWSSFCYGDWGSPTSYGTSTNSLGPNCSAPNYGHGSTDDYYCSNWELVDTDSYEECYDDNPPSPGEGTGPTEPTTPGSNNVVDINIVNLKTPCMVSAYNSLIDAQLKSNVLGIIQGFAQSKDVTIDLIDKDLGDPNIDGETRVTNAAYKVYEITLNTGALANSSKDYIEATIIYEMLHVYLPANDGETDHEIMAEKYVKPMAFTLKAAGYALTYDDAIDLSWGGLQKTKAWKQLVDIDRVSGTNVTGKILQTSVNYKNNTGYGARCN
ncbi:hypothetical protein [Spirosoma endbachense]|uniref:Uncharacterized protein n=1 Tax=Spirosoma endbachense TaxID=2666025 RepID=A0A6P1W032_9BACT|nr:hypothetical protein [Spirosoma endbachense]QHV97380.1 hypothetical protein GJR95_21275 [Spirosoma endbachense]